VTDRIAQVRGFLFGHSGRNEELFGDALGLALEAAASGGERHVDLAFVIQRSLAADKPVGLQPLQQR